MKKIKSRKEKIKIAKTTKRHILLLSIILLVITTLSVNAGTQDSNLVRTQVNNVYAIATLEDGKHLYNLEIYKINDRLAYCLEIGKKITTNIYNSTTDLTTTSLSQEQIEHIKKIMYYGYGYHNNDYRYYMAAQEMIWEYLENIDVYWTSTLDLNGPEMNIDIYKRTIETLVNNAETIPSFAGKHYKVLAGEQFAVLDENKSLGYYNINMTNTLSYETSRNSVLTIKTNKSKLQTYEITFTKDEIYNYDSTVYYSNNSQKLISVGKIDQSSAKFTLETIGGILNIDLVDSETKDPIAQGQATLSGARYAIYDENNKVVDTFTIEEGKTTQIKDLIPNKYYIKQLKASEGYKINKNIIEFEINSLEQNIILEEEIIKSKVEILKLFGDENNFNTEIGIKFNIYDHNSKLYEKIITDELGYTEVMLVYGNYTIKQENTTPGYMKVPDISVNINENSEEVIRYNLFDNEFKVKINVTTLDKESNKNILESNISYKLKDKKTNEYVTYNDIDTFKTNDLGQVLIPKELNYGTYILEQVTTPNQYIKNKELITIEINDNSDFIYNNNELILNINYYNRLVKGIIHIKTNQEESQVINNKLVTTEIPLPNTKIEIYANEDIITPDGDTHYKKGDIVEKLVTNDEGTIDTRQLYLGEYCLKEVDANNISCVKLESKDNTKEIIEEEVIFTKKLKKYNITLNNIDENNNTIKGSVIELYTIDNELISSNITNEKGLIIIKEIPNGKYYFKQLSVDKNYILNEEKLHFEINDSNQNLTIINKIQNNKQLLDIEVPNTLSNKSFLAEILSLTLISSGIIFYVFKKKTNKSNNH